MLFLFRLAVTLARLPVRSRSNVILENLALRHRSLGLEPPAGPRPILSAPGDRIVEEPVSGGLHHVYLRVA